MHRADDERFPTPTLRNFADSRMCRCAAEFSHICTTLRLLQRDIHASVSPIARLLVYRRSRAWTEPCENTPVRSIVAECASAARASAPSTRRRARPCWARTWFIARRIARSVRSWREDAEAVEGTTTIVATSSAETNPRSSVRAGRMGHFLPGGRRARPWRYREDD